MTHRERVGTGLAALIAGLGWLSLVVDGTTVVGRDLAHGTSLPQALYLWFRYFTILTNLGVAVLMTVTVACAARRQPQPAAGWYAAALAYMLVVCVTYEVILRQGWNPSGMSFFTDLTFHDVIPALTLVQWIGYAPKRGLTWRFPPSLMIYPSLWFVMTLVAGALGESYPYSFVDVPKLGYPVVMMIGVMYLAIYYALGAALMTAARGRPVREG